MPRKVGKSEEYAEFDERARDSREAFERMAPQA
jgi:hypothetical protein